MPISDELKNLPALTPVVIDLDARLSYRSFTDGKPFELAPGRWAVFVDGMRLPIDIDRIRIFTPAKEGSRA